MAKERAVWGIDIGQSALKAMRCFRNEEGQIVADSFDFVEYPKSLSMPDADAEELVREAMEDFLSRNDLKGDRVAMTIAGQAGLCRFFKPPPVDSKTLPDIVKYEVKQQIPFPVEDIIWDWQGLGGREMEGVIVDSEVGLFAIKRDAVFTALQPFINSDLEVDLVQLSPLAIHNVICEELLEAPAEVEEGEEDEDDLVEQDYLMTLSIGTDATDLLITNGVKLWLRNIPIGGNHFTKQLSRELKLTQTKAEHLKRNAHQAENPKTIFQAMRPVFNDLVMEIQRSLSFYGGMEKDANVEKLVLLGNAARLPGLRQYLNRQLGLSITKVANFKNLKGEISEEKIFQENLLAFAPCYGLCLQELKQSHIKTNLLPHEFVFRRIIESKKPWALASVSLVMLGMMFGLFFATQKLWGVSPDYSAEGVSWKQATAGVAPLEKQSQSFFNEDQGLHKKLKDLNLNAVELAGQKSTANAWPELYSALSQILPRDSRMGESDRVNPNDIPFLDREELYVVNIESVAMKNLQSEWLQPKEGTSILDLFNEQQEEGAIKIKTEEELEAEALAKKEAKNKKKKKKNKKKKAKPTHNISKPGFIVEIVGYHDYNSREKQDLALHGRNFVKNTLIDGLLKSKIELPGENGELEEFQFSDIGVFYPTVVHESEIRKVIIPKQDDLEGSMPGPNVQETEDASDPNKVDRYDFIVQFAFIPASIEQRLQARTKRQAKETAAAEKKEKEDNKKET